MFILWILTLLVTSILHGVHFMLTCTSGALQHLTLWLRPTADYGSHRWFVSTKHKLMMAWRDAMRPMMMQSNWLKTTGATALTKCIPISDVASRQHLRSARRHYLTVLWYSLSSYGRRAFAVAGPTDWNSLRDDLCDLTLITDSFGRLLKTRLFSKY